MNAQHRVHFPPLSPSPSPFFAAMAMHSADSSRLVVVDYEDVASSKADLSIQLESAFGGLQSSTLSSPLGIIAIRNVPTFIDAKEKFLSLAHALAHLEPGYLETHLSDPTSLYNSGW